MFIGAIIAIIFFSSGVFLMLEAVGSENDQTSRYFMLASFASLFLWVISSAFSFFGFIDYLRN
jgi:hypothetical protein